MKFKSQSAMEYLMTYGWAILIIAVVLGVLFQLGIFSGSALAPKAQPGSCQVFRTSAATSLEGECQGELPQYVASVTSGDINIPAISNLDGLTSVTLSEWVYINNVSSSTDILSDDCSVASGGRMVLQAFMYPGQVEYDFGSGPGWFVVARSPLSSISSGKWYHIVGTWTSGSGISIYLNGAAQTVTYTVGSSSTTGSLGAPTSGMIGAAYYGCAPLYLNGYIANVQIYNTTLASAEVQALYLEGIGGAPIRPQNLITWYPLNGNANDYSGNNYNGADNGITYVNSWESGYTPP